MISVIITTAPGREANLNACLQSIAEQTLAPVEVIVTDDGYTGEAVTKQWQTKLPVQYLGRDNDRCVARSRNRAAAIATQPFFVMLDGDILLNPEGLAAYQRHFEANPEALWSGYFGNNFQHTSPARWLDTREINYVDKRFEACFPQQFYPFAQLLSNPGFFFWGGNMGIPQSKYAQLKGFNTEYTGWGDEDVEFALRAIHAGLELHFSVDAWGEHQVHPRNNAFFQKSTEEQHRKKALLAQKHPEINYRVNIACQDNASNVLHQLLRLYYPQHDPLISAQLKAKLQHPNANLVTRIHPDHRLELGCALSH